MSRQYLDMFWFLFMIIIGMTKVRRAISIPIIASFLSILLALTLVLRVLVNTIVSMIRQIRTTLRTLTKSSSLSCRSIAGCSGAACDLHPLGIFELKKFIMVWSIPELKSGTIFDILKLSSSVLIWVKIMVVKMAITWYGSVKCPKE